MKMKEKISKKEELKMDMHVFGAIMLENDACMLKNSTTKQLDYTQKLKEIYRSK